MFLKHWLIILYKLSYQQIIPELFLKCSEIISKTVTKPYKLKERGSWQAISLALPIYKFKSRIRGQFSLPFFCLLSFFRPTRTGWIFTGCKQQDSSDHFNVHMRTIMYDLEARSPRVIFDNSICIFNISQVSMTSLFYEYDVNFLYALHCLDLTACISLRW
jgi:hypothetical protein